MTSSTGLRTTVLVIAAILVATVITVVACAPASPNSQAQNGDPTKAPTPPPTNTPETIIIYQDNTPVAIQLPPVPLTPYVLIDDLRRESTEYEATKEATTNAGRSADTMEDPIRKTFITVDSLERSNEVATFLESRSVAISSKNENPSYAEFVVVAYVPRSLLKELSYMEGITRIEAFPGPSNQSPEPSSQMGGPILNLNTISGVATWYGAGIKGGGLHVGIIDGGFQDIRTRVPAAFARPTVTPLCFQPGVDEPTEGHDDDPFQHCEAFTDHGTSVAEKLVEVAPQVRIYISNPHNREQLRQAVNWMTAKALDNDPDYQPEPAYTATSNDRFDIKVINMSRAFLWDGPGDGTSPLEDTDNYSPIRSANDAIANGALWVNAAGNTGQNSWFSSNIRLHNQNNQLEVDFDSDVGTDTCNDMTLKRGQKYTFQARWKDQWGGATKDLDLHLMGPRRDGGQLELLEESENAQNGGLTDYPREIIRNFTAKADGMHCLMLTTGNPADRPEWIQLQVFDGDTTQGFQFKHPELLSSINNPAESNNPGLMAIGNSLALIHIALSRESSRGPVPEPAPGDPNRPDVAGANAILGTSFSSARVAGMAALVIDALGNNAKYSEPHQIAKYLRDNAAQYTPGQNGFISTHPNDPSTLTNQDPNPHWGHGLAFLPQPEKPKNVTIALVPGTKDQIKILYRNEPWDADLDFSRQQTASINIRATGGTGAALYERLQFIRTADESLTIQVRRGTTYQATVVRCPYVFSLTCTERSDLSNELYLPSAPQTPTNIRAIPGHEGATIKWHNPGNTGDVGNFEIEELGGPKHTSDTTKAVIRNLENGTVYQFRVRAVLGDEQSGWTTWFPVTPEDSKPGAPTNIAYGNYDTSIFLHWRGGTNADTYQVQQWDGSARRSDGKMGAWKNLPFRQSGHAKQYEIDFLGLGRAARIDNLTPGTAYKYKLRSLNIDRHSQWSEQISISTTGQNPDPNPTPTPTPTPNKTQPEGLTAVISGTNVVLTWTKGENPNYVSQVVRRRVAGVRPEQWTDATVGVNDITYTDTTVQSGTKYIYRVHALKNNGVKSELTNPAYATVP